MVSGNAAPDVDFFISRAGADKAMAELIADIVRDAGLAPFYQDEHFGQADFMRRMEEGYARSARMIAVLSSDYQKSEYCRAEYNHVLGKDPSNLNGRLIVLRVADCQPVGSLQNLAYTDLAPVLTDAQALTRVVRVALGIDERPAERAFWQLYSRAGQQIRHPEIRPAKGFMGRAGMLESLAAKLWLGDSDTVAIRNSAETTLTLRGLGGVGKTLLAKQYAWDNRDRYHGVWWIRAETRETIVDDLAALGRRLIPGLDAREPEDAALATLDRIAQMHTGKPWLLVYDNVDNQDTVRGLTPPDNAHVLITSRLTEWYGEAEELPVDVFDRDTAIDFLLADARRETRDKAGRLADALDRLPLALSHARAYCRARNWPFERYIESLPELIRKVPSNAPYPKSVFATFSLAIDRAIAACPEAERLMGLLAFFAPDQIPLWLIPETVLSEHARGDAIAALGAVSLLEWEDLSDGTPGVAVHRLVQEVMRARLTEGGNSESAAAEATRLVFGAYDRSESFEAIDRNTHLLPHELAVLPHAPREGADAQNTLWVLLQTGNFRLSRGETGAALAAYRDGRDMAQRQAESDRENAVWWQTNLSFSHDKIGDVLARQGNLAQALESYRSSMAIRERLAEADPENAGWQRDLSVARQKIGDVLVDQGNLAQALESYRESHVIFKRLAAADRGNAGWLRDLSVSHNKIGDVLRAQGNLAQALESYRASMAIAEWLAWADPGNTRWQRDLSVSHSKIGDVLRAQGNLAQAQENYRASMDIIERLAEADPENAGWQRGLSVALSQIGDVLALQGNLAQALASYRASHAMFERLADADAENAGGQHDVARSLMRIGWIAAGSGERDEALRACRHGLGIMQRLVELAPDHAAFKKDRDWLEGQIAELGE